MATKYVDKDALQEFAIKMNAKQKTIFATKGEVGTPLVAATAAAMTDTSKIYVYTGSETGYTAGDWYYYDGSDWQSGGVYNSAAVQTDTSLSVSGMAADAKTVGDDLDALDGRLDNCVTESEMTAAISANVDATLSVSGKSADAKAAGDSIGEITKKMVAVKSANKWNPNALTSGYMTANGTEGANASYAHPSDPIPVSPGDVVRSYEVSSNNNFVAAGMRWLCALNSSKQAVTASGSNSNITSYTVPEGIAYVVPTMNITTSKQMVTVNLEATEYVDYKQYYVAGPEFHDNISIDSETDFDNVYLDFTMIGRLNPSDCDTGEIVSASTGQNSSNSSYFTTDYMPIYPHETLYFYRIDTKALKNARIIAAYDKDKNVISNAGVSSETDHYTQTGDVAYIKCSFAYYDSDYIRTPYGTSVMANAEPTYCTQGGNSIIKNKYTRDRIYISTSDTEGEIIQKFVDAFLRGSVDVIFERGTYNFGTELVKIDSDYGMSINEIPIGNDCRYFFNGSTLSATIDLSQLTPQEGEDEFYCNFLGCQRRPSSFELHDGVLIATDTRYVVHDESSAMPGSYKHLYQNMEMHYHTISRTEAIRKCIGGGTGENGVVEIVGCKFTTDATDVCVSFHGNGTDVVGAEFDLNVRDSYFSNNLRAGELSEHQTARLFYCNNSAADAPNTYANWTVTAFLNETR